MPFNLVNVYLTKKLRLFHAGLILLFSSKVGDFGLARWQPDGDTGVETRVIGTFG